uniref:Teneurin N-terminal domain-containing protein n=1 Tax=Hucho hucho TaxID=62062 RepID=A0A4W5RWW3_9TELE
MVKSKGPPNHHHSQSLRPPLPPPHNHHQSSASSLNPNTLASRRGPAHAPSAAPGEGPSTPESVQLQDSWALNSSVPLETRSVTLSPCHPVTLSPYHPVTLSPYHPVTLPCHPVTLSPCHPVTLPCHPALSPCPVTLSFLPACLP